MCKWLFDIEIDIIYSIQYENNVNINNVILILMCNVNESNNENIFNDIINGHSMSING